MDKYAHSSIGTSLMDNLVVMRAYCPFCNSAVTFRQKHRSAKLYKPVNRPIDLRYVDISRMVSLECEACSSLVTYSLEKKKMYPSVPIKGVEGLPDGINKYYAEALDCLSAQAPNGAVTLFRKVIHAIGIHYEIAIKNDNKNLYTIINSMYDEGHIVKKLKDALLAVKDIGNDGAHINENEPDMDQAIMLKELVDTVLKSTIICDESLESIAKIRTK